MHRSPSSGDRASLDFDAFLYVTGELDPRLVEPFERRLAEDSKAQQAVAQAVALLESVAVAEADCRAEHSGGVRPSRASWGSGWRAMIAALTSVAALLAAAKLLPHQHPDSPPALAESSTAQLAMVWVETYPILSRELDLSAELHEMANADLHDSTWSVSSFSQQDDSWNTASLVSDDGWIEAAVESMTQNAAHSVQRREGN